MENNYFKDSKDVLGTFYTNQLGYWQVGGNIFDNVVGPARPTNVAQPALTCSPTPA